jgi:hypothetical protein
VVVTHPESLSAAAFGRVSEKLAARVSVAALAKG